MKLWKNDKNVLRIVKDPAAQETQNGDLCVANERGIFSMFSALAIMGLLGFMALSVQAGQWYVTRAELSKAVDAAAFAGAKNYSNPYLSPTDLMAEVGQANFSRVASWEHGIWLVLLSTTFPPIRHSRRNAVSPCG